MKAYIHVTLKEGVLDPQGKAIGSALHGMGFNEAMEVRAGKMFEIELGDVANDDALHSRLSQMCEKLLANTVIEDYRIEVK